MTRQALVLLAAIAALGIPGTALAAQPVPVSYHAWTSSADFDAGTYAGTAKASGGGAITLASKGTANVTYTDSHYGDIAAVAGTWTSPWLATGFGFSELVSSWNADTPSGTWLQVELQGVTSKGTQTKWFVMGRWAYGDD